MDYEQGIILISSTLGIVHPSGAPVVLSALSSRSICEFLGGETVLRFELMTNKS